MLNFPKATEFNKRIPKEKFYSVGSFSAKDKAAFINDVDKIIWSNKISEQTVNISSGKEINEIQVITVVLKRKDYDSSIINTIRKLIPYHILFKLEYEGMVRLAVYHTKLITSEWMPTEDCSITLSGLDLDTVWEEIVKSVEGGEWSVELSLEENILQKDRIEKLQKEIARLEKQARNEKQPKKKFELVQKLKNLKGDMNNDK